MDNQISFRIRQIFFNSLFVFILIVGTACSDSKTEILNTIPQADSIVKANDFQSDATSEFISVVSRQNINLNKQDLIMIQELARVNPTGEWTPGDENNSMANLTQHFLKHGHDFVPPFQTPQEYLSAALRALKNGSPEYKYYLDLAPYKDGKIISLVKWNSKSKEFVVWRLNGQIASYFPANNLRPDRYINIPDEMR